MNATDMSQIGRTAASRTPVRSLFIPLARLNLLLPNSAVAEVAYYTKPEPISESPGWLLGLLPWRGRSLPLISFELACMKPSPPPGPQTKLAIINALGGNSELNFFAIATQGLPQLLQVDEDTVAPLGNDMERNPMILSHVTVAGLQAIIPDLDALEAKLLYCRGLWQRS